MRSKRKKCSKLLALLLAAVTVFTVAACGNKTVSLNVIDGKTATEVSIAAGKTVSDALAEAGVILNEKDQVSPAADAQITEDLTQIVIERAVKVSVVDGDRTTEVELAGATVGDALKAAGITLTDRDSIAYAEEDALTEGMKIEIAHKEYKKVSVKVDGKTTDYETDAATVGDLLKEQNIELGKDDVVSPKEKEVLENGATIKIKRVTYKEETVTEEIPFGYEEAYTDSMYSGESTVSQYGVNGSKEVTYKVKYVNGKEKSREAVSEKVTQEPVSQIVTYGTAQYSAPAASGGKTIVSQEAVPSCADGSHGYYVITYSDGSVDYQEY